MNGSFLDNLVFQPTVQCKDILGLSETGFSRIRLIKLSLVICMKFLCYIINYALYKLVTLFVKCS